MTYEEFLSLPSDFRTDMLRVLNIKMKYSLDFTDQEREINYFLLQYDEDQKLTSLRNHFEKCWGQEK